MKIEKTLIDGCFIIERDFFKDERGYFSRAFCRKTLEENGINADFVQSNLSENIKKYTLRGLHSQKAPYAEDKLVMCTRGSITDVCVDVRKDSPTYKKYVAVNLTEENGKCLYVPKGCAHGYISLEDDSQVLYYVTYEYTPNSEECYRFNDPAFNINWGVDESLMIISEKDKKHNLIGE
ncbi:MAG: dTDP-4-dehydrorhamnose 3,5-epimerase [Clostridiales bacterium]|nr:dTDP-4-dehydrorhamnose 3,5-epimerase [Clostridiales bacterium]